MKHGKKLTREQKIKLRSLGLDEKDWLSVKNLPDKTLFIHRETGKTFTLPKEGQAS